MKTFRISFIFVLGLSGSTAFAQNQLCNTNFLEGTTAAGVQRSVSAGADANGVCNASTRIRPLHQALSIDTQVSPDVIQALINAGGDVTASSILGTVLEISEEKFEEAVAAFQMGQITFQQFSQRQAVYEVVNSGLEALSTAYQNLCDTNWWRGASGPSMVSLLNSSPGLDPNRGCNPGNDRPLHIALRSIEPFTLDTGNAIAALITNANANLQASNNSGETPASLLEVQYDRLKIRTGVILDELCRNITQVSIDRYNNLNDRDDPTIMLYMYIRERMGESNVFSRLHMDLYGSPQGAANVYQTCDYRRNTR